MHTWTFRELDSVVMELASRVEARARQEGVERNLSGIVTGSFASFKRAEAEGKTTPHKPRMTHPDVNLYFFVSDPRDRRAALAGHGYAVTEFRRACRERGILALVDTHPFVTPTYPDDFARDDLALVQFTTLTVTLRDLQSHLPTVCRESWATHYFHLFGEDVLKPYVGSPVARNELWVASKLRGMVDYAGALNRLQLGISSGAARVEAIFHQALLYLWEVLKEGIPAGLSDEEFDSGLERQIREGKRERLAPYYEERYGTLSTGVSARRIVELGLELDDNYLNHRHDLGIAQTAIEYALDLGSVVHEKLAALYSRKLQSNPAAMQAAMAQHLAWY